jgi:hypothetical protein
MSHRVPSPPTHSVLVGLLEVANAELERRSEVIKSKDHRPGIGNRGVDRPNANTL